ncbi:MAG: hypothetical protein OQL16_09240 [Gammaproteobacteria bacterium]|nr:hypothetical protein [Gammaproteobacteria bacterium]
MNNQVDNPYQAPQANIIPADSEMEEIRSLHIRHEATIKSIGILYYLGAFFMFIASAGMAATALAEPPVSALTIASIFLLLGIFQFWAARLLRALSPRAKIPVTIFSVIGLTGFPVGTIINLYILYAIYCKKGRFILSKDYQEIVAATPDIKHQTSILVWIFMGLIVLAIVAAIAIPEFYQPQKPG